MIDCQVRCADQQCDMLSKKGDIPGLEGTPGMEMGSGRQGTEGEGHRRRGAGGQNA